MFSHLARLLLFICFLSVGLVRTKAQENSGMAAQETMSLNKQAELSVEDEDSIEKDISDIWMRIRFSKKEIKNKDSINQLKRLHFAIVPGVGYSMQTGFAGFIAANGVFKTKKNAETNQSSVFTLVSVTQYKQLILPLILSIWTPKNKYHIVSDNRFMKFPSLTYGIGQNSLEAPASAIEFLYLKMRQTVMKKVAPNFYMGLGYYFDRFWNIREDLSPRHRGAIVPLGSNIDTEALASGMVAKVTFDSRPRLINPPKGLYASLLIRDNTPFFGGDSRWRTGLLEVRKFFTLPGKSKNILAFWSHNWFTLNGNPHYLMLPSTGWDDYFNTGRGHIQGRFRGSDMFYLEGEFRYKILRSGLLGGVLFGNVQYFTGSPLRSDQIVVPAGGIGLRIKVNKKSATNLAIDYGIGINGSRGFFVNLGESF